MEGHCLQWYFRSAAHGKNGQLPAVARAFGSSGLKWGSEMGRLRYANDVI